ncbi:hypothetical protein IT408_04120 [Candidatus Uhrbacteria bacterium]|nr:hypothetical protein [Candidatus Uhrbacteria bacterium]
MSFQRVFESARKLGLPVIVTDPSGHEPFVLLPLDQFEALTGESESHKTISFEKKGEKKLEEKFASSLHIANKELISPKTQPMKLETQSETELLLEERFYLGSEELES